MDGHPAIAGRLEHTEFSTVSVTVGSGGGLARVSQGTGPGCQRAHTCVWGMTALAPSEGDFQQEQFSPS